MLRSYSYIAHRINDQKPMFLALVNTFSDDTPRVNTSKAIGLTPRKRRAADESVLPIIIALFTCMRVR